MNRRLSNKPSLMMNEVEIPECWQEDERLLEDCFDFGEWASVRQSRLSSVHHRAYQGNVLSYGCLGWLFRVVKHGWAHKLIPEDLPGLQNDIMSCKLVPELEKSQILNGKRSFAKVLWGIPRIRKSVVAGSILTSIQGIVGTVARPLVLKVVIQAVQEPLLQLHKALLLLLAIGVVVFMEGWLGVHGRQMLGEDFATEFQVASSSAVYKKMLRINTQLVREDASTEISLIGNDIVRAYENIRTAQNLPMAISGVIGGVIVLALIIGYSSLVGLAIMFLILLINLYIGKRTHAIEQCNLKVADQRLSMLSRILEGIKAVKFFGWEKPFMVKLDAIREIELKYIKKYRLLHVTSIATGRGSPVLSSMATLLFYVLSGNTLTLADAYATISVFQALRLSLIMVPLGLTSSMAFDVTLKRLDEYLERPEKPPATLVKDTSEVVLELKGCKIGWPIYGNNDEGVILRALDLSLSSGSIVAVVGRVGSGKSTLLATAVQALLPIKGTVSTTASLGYSPQKAFMISGSIKQNILIGRPYTKERFNDALERSGLSYDLTRLEAGVLTEIGERGTTLSGGQQTRMAIARALYSYPELLVLDDPLSAVDPKVAAHIFKKCVLDLVKSGACKGCLLSLNQIDLLPQFDKIVFLHEGTAIQGTYEELLKHCPEFELFVQSSSYQEEESIEEAVETVVDSNNESVRGTTLLGVESRKSGAVAFQVYKQYAQDQGLIYFFTSISLCLSGYILMSLNDYWLSVWANANGENNVFYASIYATMSVCFALLILLASFMMSLGGVNASKSIHRNMITKLLNAPMFWFDSTSSGRIMSRFSGDLAKVDMILSLSVDNLVQIFCNLIVLLALLVVAVPFMAIIVALIMVVYGFLLVAVDRSARDVKRISNNALSPLLSNAAEAVQGRDVVISMKCTTFFEARHRLATDEYARATFASGSLINFAFLCSHWLSFVVAVCSAALLLTLDDKYVSNSLLGLALTYAFLVPYFASTMTQVVLRMNSFFTSLERLLEYGELPQENSSEDDDDPDVEEWPVNGDLAFNDVYLKYGEGMPFVLKGVSFEIPAGSLVGICGRTGSGKSSCISALFRLVELQSGSITIDGRDTRSIALATLRDRLTIIPQDPVLMEGTIRSNLDPFDNYSDGELSTALKTVDMSVGLGDIVESSGKNWSCGERQLICFARAFLRRHCKIIVMDEPTSAIDMNTDELMQKLVKVVFKGKTVLCIAHRLETLIDYDLVMVLKDGLIEEIDTPKSLLDRSDSEFLKMVSAMGMTSRNRLIAKASSSYVSHV